jgi:urease accessory protein
VTKGPAIQLALASAGLLLAAPRIASAHLVSTGAGPFYDGAAHVLVSIEEVLPVVALSVLAGLRGAEAGRRLLAVLPIAWLAGSAVGLTMSIPEIPTPLAVGLVLIPGVLIALDRDLPATVLAALFAAFGLACGVANGSAMAVSGGWLGVVGGAAAAAVASALVTAAALIAGRSWPRIALRVAGSWMAAFGLLALGWAYRVG